MTRQHRTALLALAAAAALALAGCTSTPSDQPSASGSSSGAALHGTVTVYAAASLKKAFDEIAGDFEKANPGVTVAPIDYDGSSTLATQLIGGAKVDVFASADQANMTKVTDAKLASDPQLFASNTLVVAVPKGNPAKITTIDDLGRNGVKVVLCAPAVPCGAAAQKLLSAQGVTVKPVSEEQNVTAVLTKIAAGEADAGLVYTTDVKGRDDVDSFVPAGAAAVVNHYPIVALDAAPNPTAAAAFVAFVMGPAGQAVLKADGFGSP